LLFLSFFPLCYRGKIDRNRIEKEIDSFTIYIDHNPEAAHHHIKNAYQQSVAIGNDSLIARSLCNMAYYDYLKRDYASARAHYSKAITYSRQIKYFKILAYSYSQLGMMASDEDHFDQALRYYLASFEVC